MEQAHPIALLVNQETAAVVTAMRQNSKWALVANRYSGRASLGCSDVAPGCQTAVCQHYLVLQGDEVGDDPWMEFDWFKHLRKRVFQWKGAPWYLHDRTIPTAWPGSVLHNQFSWAGAPVRVLDSTFECRLVCRGSDGVPDTIHRGHQVP